MKANLAVILFRSGDVDLGVRDIHIAADNDDAALRLDEVVDLARSSAFALPVEKLRAIADTPDPDDGVIGRDPGTGKPTGLLLDGALHSVLL